MGSIAAALRTSRVAFDVVELTPPARPTPRGGDERADVAIGVAVWVECLDPPTAGSAPNQPSPNIGDDNPDPSADTWAANAAAGFPAARPPTFRVLTRPGLATAASGTDLTGTHGSGSHAVTAAGRPAPGGPWPRVCGPG
jgi:hypothetical protein